MPKLELHYWVDGKIMDSDSIEVEISQKDCDNFLSYEDEEEICSAEWRIICDFIARSVILLDINDTPVVLFLEYDGVRTIVYEF